MLKNMVQPDRPQMTIVVHYEHAHCMLDS